MKTIKIYVEGGVVQHVGIPTEYAKLLDVEIIDYDNLDAIEEEIKEAAHENQ